jgi:phosphoesterase RecJ-like protein
VIGPEDHARFGALLERARLFVLVTHVNPDGDAIGSEVSLARALRGIGGEVRIVNQDAAPETLRWLEDEGPGSEAYDPGRHDGLLDAADAIVLLDNSAPDRLGRMESPVRARATKTFCIDHHPTRGTPWAETIIDDSACATAAIVFELLEGRGLRVDPQTAEALYAGLATDTGFFRFNSTSSRAFRIAAKLLDAGADPTRSFREVYERNSPAYTRLLGRALSGLTLEAGGVVGVIGVTRRLVEESGAEDVDTSEVTTPVLAVDGVRIAVFFRELADGRVKVSLRSKGALDVQKLASEFGGGGHRNASGIVMPGPYQDVVARVTARAAALAEDGR